VCYLSGMTPKDISKRFSIAENTIYTKIGKAGWYKIKKEAIAQEPEPQEVEALAKVMEEDWKSKGAAHRAQVFKIAHDALKSARLPTPRSWKDAQIADNMARKAVGLDEERGNTAVINVGFIHKTAGNAVTRIENDVVDAEFVAQVDRETGSD
jgi:hypothetical protein